MDESHEFPGEPVAPPVGSVSIRGTAAAVLFGAALIYLLRESAAFGAPMLVSLLLTYALEPFVRAFRRLRLPRPLAVVAVYFVVALALVAGAQSAKRQTVAFLAELPPAIASVKESMLRQHAEAQATGQATTIDHLQQTAADLQAALASTTPPAAGVTRVAPVGTFDFRDYLGDIWASAIGAGATFLAIAVLTFVLLLGSDHLKRKLVLLAGPTLERRKLTLDVIREIDRQIERYLTARVLISAIVAAATAAGMWWLGVRQPLVLGTIAGILNVLPFVGPAIAVLVCALEAFLQFHRIEPALTAGVVATAVAAIEGNVLTPWLTGRAGELNTVAVFVSVLFWGWMWDMWGLLLAVPIMVSLKAAADQIEPLQPLGELLGR